MTSIFPTKFNLLKYNSQRRSSSVPGPHYSIGFRCLLDGLNVLYDDFTREIIHFPIMGSVTGDLIVFLSYGHRSPFISVPVSRTCLFLSGRGAPRLICFQSLLPRKATASASGSQQQLFASCLSPLFA